MDIDQLEEKVNKIVKDAKGFLCVLDMSEEEKQAFCNTAPTPLQLTAFNAIVKECKSEIATCTKEKIAQSLMLLYNLNIQPLNLDLISQSLEKFVQKQLNPVDFHTSESKIRSMQEIVKNTHSIIDSIAIKLKEENQRSKKWYVFNAKIRERLSTCIRTLSQLQHQIELQMEYDAKKLIALTIDDFYNTYIFFSYIAKISRLHGQELMLIEIANYIDRYIKVIRKIFNNRHLQNQDMLYYYVAYELSELKDGIYHNVNLQNY